MSLDVHVIIVDVGYIFCDVVIFVLADFHFQRIVSMCMYVLIDQLSKFMTDFNLAGW